MDVNSIVYQLRQYCPVLASVAAGGYLQIISDQTNLPLPAAFVLPVQGEATDNDSLTSEFQVINETFAVVVALDNTTDPRGQLTATISVHQVLYALFSALVGWYIETEPSTKAVYFSRYVPLPELQDRSRAWWSFEFVNQVVIDNSYGFTPPSDPLTNIETNISLPAAPVTPNVVADAESITFPIVFAID